MLQFQQLLPTSPSFCGCCYCCCLQFSTFDVSMFMYTQKEKERKDAFFFSWLQAFVERRDETQRNKQSCNKQTQERTSSSTNNNNLTVQHLLSQSFIIIQLPRQLKSLCVCYLSFSRARSVHCFFFLCDYFKVNIERERERERVEAHTLTHTQAHKKQQQSSSSSTTIISLQQQ